MQRILFVALLCAAVMMSACANNRHANNAMGADAEQAAVAQGAPLTGTAVDAYMDRQLQALKQQLREKRHAGLVRVFRLPGNTLVIRTASAAEFTSGGAKLSAQVEETLRRITTALVDYKSTAVHVVGHTDSVGRAETNMKLSRERAASVARFLVRQGVDARRVLTWGRSEAEPIASNANRAGRALNRRVDIVIKPLIKGRALAAYSEPPFLGEHESAQQA